MTAPPDLNVRPGTIFDCLVPPSLTVEWALCGRRPVIAIAEDERLGVLVAPVTSGVRDIKLPTVHEGGLLGQVHVHRLRWVPKGNLYPWTHGSLSTETIRFVLSAAREPMIAAGLRDLYRSAKRSI